jgi:hypothetical protein
LISRPGQIPELEWSYAAAAGGIINTTDVVLAAAAGAGFAALSHKLANQKVRMP